MRAREDIITAAAGALGFPLAGCTPLGALPRAAFMRDWLADGRAGEMRYLERSAPARLDATVAFPWARAVVVVGVPYRPPPPPPADWRSTLQGRIAAYALGTDYHVVVPRRLAALAARLGEAFPGTRWEGHVDTGPLVEREWAARAGLGWIGRNTLLLHRVAGSYFFLAELVTDLALDARPLPADHCGTCTRCVDACPTGALERGYTMDPRRCLSYLTIEHRSAIPVALRSALENWIFGCDVCQEVCPWNRDVGADAAALAPPLVPLLALDEAAFQARFGTTALARPRRSGLLRNVAVALGNSGNPAAVAPLAQALGTDRHRLVRGHAAWALGRLGGAAARAALEGRRRRDPDASVRAEIDAALERSC